MLGWVNNKHTQACNTVTVVRCYRNRVLPRFLWVNTYIRFVRDSRLVGLSGTQFISLQLQILGKFNEHSVSTKYGEQHDPNIDRVGDRDLFHHLHAGNYVTPKISGYSRKFGYGVISQQLTKLHPRGKQLKRSGNTFFSTKAGSLEEQSTCDDRFMVYILEENLPSCPLESALLTPPFMSLWTSRQSWIAQVDLRQIYDDEVTTGPRYWYHLWRRWYHPRRRSCSRLRRIPQGLRRSSHHHCTRCIRPHPAH